MEVGRRRSAMVVLVILSMVLGQSSADFTDCYRACFIICVITPGSLLQCATKCLKDCIFPSSINSLNDKQQTHFFCKFGCASSLCSNLSSRQDPREEKVASCVNSCSNRCSKNYSP